MLLSVSRRDAGMTLRRRGDLAGPDGDVGRRIDSASTRSFRLNPAPTPMPVPGASAVKSARRPGGLTLRNRPEVGAAIISILMIAAPDAEFQSPHRPEGRC